MTGDRISNMGSRTWEEYQVLNLTGDLKFIGEICKNTKF